MFFQENLSFPKNFLIGNLIVSGLSIGTASAYNNEAMREFALTSICLSCDLNQACMSVIYQNCQLENPGQAYAEPLQYSHHAHGILTGSYLYGATLEQLNLSWAHLTNLTGQGVSLFDNQLDYANFAYSDLPDLRLSNQQPINQISFLGANLARAHITDQTLHRAIFSTADMTGANLSDSEFIDSTFRSVLLDYADLSNSLFAESDLTHASFTGADLTGADLSSAYADDIASLLAALNQADSLCDAQLPNGEIGICAD